MPATERGVLTLKFGVLKNHKVSEQQIGNQTPSATAVRLNRIDAAAAAWLLVLYVVTEKRAELGSVRANHLRKVILPDEEVLVIVPRRLMPEIPISSRPQPTVGNPVPSTRGNTVGNDEATCSFSVEPSALVVTKMSLPAREN